MHTRLVVNSLLTCCALVPGPASAVFDSNGLNPGFCETKSIRQTIVYVDDMLMTEGKTDWAKKLLGKLRASLSPGERTTVVRLSPRTGQSSEIWSGCWPSYTAAQVAELKKQTYLFGRNPLDGLKEQQEFFARD